MSSKKDKWRVWSRRAMRYMVKNHINGFQPDRGSWIATAIIDANYLVVVVCWCSTISWAEYYK